MPSPRNIFQACQRAAAPRTEKPQDSKEARYSFHNVIHVFLFMQVMCQVEIQGLRSLGLLMCSFFFKHLFPRLLLSSMLLLMILSNFRSCPMALFLLPFVNSGAHVCSPCFVFLGPLVGVLFSFILVLMMSSYFLSCLIAMLGPIFIDFDFHVALVSLCLISSWYEYLSRHSYI